MAKFDLSAEPDRREPAYFSLQIAEARRFFAPKTASDRRFRVRVLGGGVERCQPGYRIDRDAFAYTGVEFVARGKGWLKLDGAEHALIPGMAFCYGRHTPHQILSDDEHPLVKYFVNVEGPGVKPLLSEAKLLPGGVAYSIAPSAVLALFDELIRSGTSQPGTRWRRCCGALFEAMCCLIADTRVAAPGRAHASAAFDTYLRARRELNLAALSIRSARELAERCGVSEAYLCRLFARFAAGQTPYQLLLQLKIDHAARRLAEDPGLLVKQISTESGFGDPFSFSRAFRAVTGRSPLQVRSTGSAR